MFIRNGRVILLQIIGSPFLKPLEEFSGPSLKDAWQVSNMFVTLKKSLIRSMPILK